MNSVLARYQTNRSKWWNVVFGIWLIVSPFVLGYSTLPAATWNSALVGVALAVLALGEPTQNRIKTGMTLMLAFWLLLSPFALGFQSARVAVWNNIVVTALIVLFSGTGRPPALSANESSERE